MREDEVFCTHCGYVGKPGRSFVNLGGGVYVCLSNAECSKRAANRAGSPDVRRGLGEDT